MTSAELRQSFLEYFQTQGHQIVASSSLVPTDDPTLLFTNAGMNQFKDVFLGKERRGFQRAATSQKCMRVSGKHNDLDNVGPSLRHHTFFEMLGNFSFGDYFKTDAIPFAWQLLTDVWKLPQDRLYATVFAGNASIPRDDEAYSIWQHFVPNERIAEMGETDNFWAMGDTGPCGRCSEIHFHRGDHLPCGELKCLGIDCKCDRYVEIWNNVFMEFNRQADGILTPLPAPSIDTGMGLERIVAVIQNKLSNYDTDLFTTLLTEIGTHSGVAYGPLNGLPSNDTSDVSIRVIADHMRAMTFLISDGVFPSNEYRGYVLRKIMRRAMRHGKKLGMTEPFLHRLVDVVVTEMDAAYPELSASRNAIAAVVLREEDQFDKVLSDGLPRLEAIMAEAENGSRSIESAKAFLLYDTFGLPFDFIEDAAGERKLRVDRAGFEQELETQRKRSRSGQLFSARTENAFHYRSEDARRKMLAAGDRFDGYETSTVSGVPIVAIFNSNRQQIDDLEEGASGFVALAHTPFYIESGGQVSDKGYLRADAGTGKATVEAMTRTGRNGPRVHVIRVTSGHLATLDLVTAEVDQPLRDATRRNHTATHLLHAALRQTIGAHVKQAGSLVAPDRLRFDFTHFEPVTPTQLAEIERVVNKHVYGNQTVHTDVRATADAIADGAMALFGEKYGDQVRVVSIPGFSLELCGGTHCRITGDIGPFAITHEGGVASGVRRIEAVTGNYAVELIQRRCDILHGIIQTLGVTEDAARSAVAKLQTDVKHLTRQVEELKVRVATRSPLNDATEDIVEVDGVKVVERRVSGLKKSTLRSLADSLRDNLGSGVVLIASDNAGKVALVVSVTKDLTNRVHAGNLVKEIAPIVGGTGGGRPDFAQAGGKLTDKIDAIFPAGEAALRRMLGVGGD